MNEYRCPQCKRLAFKGTFSGLVEIKCGGTYQGHICGRLEVFTGIIKELIPSYIDWDGIARTTGLRPAEIG